MNYCKIYVNTVRICFVCCLLYHWFVNTNTFASLQEKHIAFRSTAITKAAVHTSTSKMACPMTMLSWPRTYLRLPCVLKSRLASCHFPSVRERCVGYTVTGDRFFQQMDTAPNVNPYVMTPPRQCWRWHHRPQILKADSRSINARLLHRQSIWTKPLFQNRDVRLSPLRGRKNESPIVLV